MSLKVFLCVLAVALALGISAVWTQARTVRMGYEVADLLERRRGLVERKRRLEADLATRTTPRALAEAARRLGIVFPPPPEALATEVPGGTAP